VQGDVNEPKSGRESHFSDLATSEVDSQTVRHIFEPMVSWEVAQRHIPIGSLVHPLHRTHTLLP
jgi:hypothetical protein